MREEKLRRLEHVARLYYEQGKTQAEVAQIMHVSRPLISRMLDEARSAGIVEIRIHSLSGAAGETLARARLHMGLKGGALVDDDADDETVNQALGRAALQLAAKAGGARLGIAWGHMIGTMVAMLEAQPPARQHITDVSPLVGNSSMHIRHYHSNENTRIMAQQMMARAHYLYTPALAETEAELALLMRTEQYKAVRTQWEKLDIAIVNISNHPSVPDFATGARFGNLLVKRRAVGRTIAYYYDAAGGIIQSDHDHIIQIPLELLRRCPTVVGLCSAGTTARALAGAARTGLFTHIVAREAVMRQALLGYGEDDAAAEA